MRFEDFQIECEDWQIANSLCNVAIALVGSAVVGGISTAVGASKAAKAQTNAANQAAAISREQYEQTREDLKPYRDVGEGALLDLGDQMEYLTSPIALTQENLEKTPGYQFTKYQGLKAVQNSAAARGLGVSGAALKGAATFATGLADQTYKTQFDVENINRTNTYNRLMGLVNTGQSSAAQTGAFGATAAGQQAQALSAAGNAQAAMYNAIGGNVANSASMGGAFAYDAYRRGLYK